MIPTLIISGRPITAYSVLVTVGVLVVLFVMYRMAKKAGLDEIHALTMTLWSFAAAFVGGTLLYGVTNWSKLIALPARFSEAASFWEVLAAILEVFGGLVFYGGLIGMLFALFLYVRRRRLSARYYDLAAIGIPMFHTFGRLGCFLSGCCFGIPSKFGFVYHYSLIEQANGVRRFPIQLFEAGFNLALCLILLHLFRRKRLSGKLLSVYLFAYPVFRFFAEFLRGDAYRGFLWGLSTSQWISLLLLAGNAAVCLRRRAQHST